MNIKSIRWFAKVATALAVTGILALPMSANATPTAAGTVIGNQASATYVDSTGATRSTTSNLVQTTVAQVYSFTLQSNGSRTAAPGQTIYFPHTITNTGNGTDTFTLNAPVASGTVTQTGLVYYINASGNGTPDNFNPITTTGPLAPGQTFSYVVAVTVPSSATTGQTGTVTVSATDAGGTTVSNTDTTTVANSVVTVTQSLSPTTGPSPSSSALTVTLSYTNSGTLAATNLTLGDVIPSGMTYVTGSAQWSGSGTTTLSDSGTGNPSGISYDYGVTTAGKITATIANVAPGTSGTLTFQVNVKSGLAPTDNALGTTCTTSGCPALTTNVATFQTSTQAQAQTNQVEYVVQQTASVVLNGSATKNTSGTGTPVTVTSAAQGSSVSFPLYVWNNGNGSDSFDITVAPGTFPSGTTFNLLKSDGVTTLIDTNGNGIPDTGTIAPGSSYEIIVQAVLPAGATGNNAGAGYTASVTATSKANTGVSSSANVSLGSIIANAVDLTNNVPESTATAATGLGATGSTVILTNSVTPAATAQSTVFQVYVNNLGAAVDSYALSVTTAVPAGWSVQFYADGGSNNCSTLGSQLTATGNIAGGSNQLVCAKVTVPAISSGNASAGTYSFTFNAVSNQSAGVSDAITDAVTVTTVHDLLLTPNGAQQTYPGSSVTYTHTLTNNGNVSETVTFNTNFLTDSQVAAGWTSTAYYDSNGDGILEVGTDTTISGTVTITVAPGTSKTLFVRVFSPGSATSTSPANQTTLTATYNSGSSTASATDTTSVTNGLLLVKEQSLTSCTGTPANYTTNAISAQAGTVPGSCIGYRVTATNTSAGSISNVVVTDTLPSSTALEVGCGSPAATGGATVGGTANAEGSTGNVTASLPTLAAGASFQMTFCVKID